MAKNNRAWNLESFLDSLIVELDRARETLAVKAINKPLTYAVKDVSLEMQLFPSFDGNQVKFVTAEPGQTGASKISLQLGSITDQQIRKTTQAPMSRDDVSLEVIDEIDEDTKKSLRKIGVNSVNDLANIEKKNVDLENVGNKNVSYKNLANLLQKSRRKELPPSVKRASLSETDGEKTIVIDGKNLAIDRNFSPVAVWNGQLTDFISTSQSRLEVRIDDDLLKNGENELVITLDPFAIFKVKVKN